MKRKNYHNFVRALVPVLFVVTILLNTSCALLSYKQAEVEQVPTEMEISAAVTEEQSTIEESESLEVVESESTGQTETDPLADSTEETEVNMYIESAELYQTDGLLYSHQAPQETIVRDNASLKAYIVNNEGEFNFTKVNESGTKMYDLPGLYDDAFFETHDLILIFKEETSVSTKHTLLSLEYDEANNTIVVNIKVESPEMGLKAMAGWHHVIPVPKMPEGALIKVVYQ